MNESGSSQEPQLNEEIQQYAGRVIQLIDDYLQRKEVGNILLSTSGFELRNSFTDYIGRFLEHLPQQDRSVYIPKDNLELYLALKEVKRRLGIIEREPGKRPPGLMLHQIDSRNWREDHIITASSNPAVFYHYLGSESPGETGGGGEFLTVNLTEEQIRQLAQESGAQLPEPAAPPAPTSNRKGWQFWRKP